MMLNPPARRAHVARFLLAFSLAPLALISLRLSALLGIGLVVLILLPPRKRRDRAHVDCDDGADDEPADEARISHENHTDSAAVTTYAATPARAPGLPSHAPATRPDHAWRAWKYVRIFLGNAWKSAWIFSPDFRLRPAEIISRDLPTCSANYGFPCHGFSTHPQRRQPRRIERLLSSMSSQIGHTCSYARRAHTSGRMIRLRYALARFASAALTIYATNPQRAGGCA
jgi:hypothetical protein